MTDVRPWKCGNFRDDYINKRHMNLCIAGSLGGFPVESGITGGSLLSIPRQVNRSMEPCWSPGTLFWPFWGELEQRLMALPVLASWYFSSAALTRCCIEVQSSREGKLRVLVLTGFKTASKEKPQAVQRVSLS